MLIRPIREEEKQRYNHVVKHPLQTWEWGEFRRKTGVSVERVGFFEAGKLAKALQVSFHPIPFINKTAGYFPRGEMPDEEQLAALKQLAKKNNALFIKIEPNIAKSVNSPSAHHNLDKFLRQHDAVPGRPLFTKYTFQLNLDKPEDELFQQLKSKTRYNINLAYKKGVRIVEDTTEQGMEIYLDILSETTKRQGFYAHSPQYFRQMWQELGKTGMLRIFHAVYEDTVVTSWIMFVWGNVLYYPYGASRSIHRNVMASNLLMWEMIKFGKNEGCRMFDMWGSLGPTPNTKDPWYGFHRFKEGYGGQLTEFLGTYDIVYHPQQYKIFRFVENLRWKALRIKARLLR